MKFKLSILQLVLIIFIATSCNEKDSSPKTTEIGKEKPKKFLIINASKQHQIIDGFGVNVTPAQWREGNLKMVIDSLVDDLGCTLIRFDCYGDADWLCPSKQNADGTFQEKYLSEVYTSPGFKDAWDAFRYFNSKGIEPIFNISGSIPIAWATEQAGKKERLKDFNSYAEMVLSLVKWAREKEGLKFSLLMPFNETDLGFPEGPRLMNEDCYPAFIAIAEKLKNNGFADLDMIVMDDATLQAQRLEEIINDHNYVSQVKGFGWHTYGNGSDMDTQYDWDDENSIFRKFIRRAQESAYINKSHWLTEYGDLDQSEQIEFEFAWRSTRRLIKSLNDGVTGAIAWDGFDNYHVHDSTWALYGLIKTDTLNWTYRPKQRYYAAKQLYKFIKPGFLRTEVEYSMKKEKYARYKAPFKNMYLSAFTSRTKEDFTLVGMSLIEDDIDLEISLKDFGIEMNGKKVYYYRTSRNENCKKINELPVQSSKVLITIPERSIFTVTTVKK